MFTGIICNIFYNMSFNGGITKGANLIKEPTTTENLLNDGLGVIKLINIIRYVLLDLLNGKKTGLNKSEIFDILDDLREKSDFLLNINNYYLNIIINAIKTFDESTGKHSENVGNMILYEVDRIFESKKQEHFIDNEILELEDKNLIKYVYLVAGYLHDIGKLGILTSVLNKPSRLSKIEKSVMEKHPELGKKILTIKGIKKQKLTKIIEKFISFCSYTHHVKTNYGKNSYPKLDSSENVFKMANYISIVDIFEGSSSKRIYQKINENENKSDENKNKELFLKGLFTLYIERDGLNNEFINFFVSKFGINNFISIAIENVIIPKNEENEIKNEKDSNKKMDLIYKYILPKFSDFFYKEIDFNKNEVENELLRIEKSLITSDKTKQESKNADYLGIFTEEGNDIEIITNIIKKLGLNFASFETIEGLNYDGKIIQKIYTLKLSIEILLGKNIDNFGDFTLKLFEKFIESELNKKKS